VLPPLVHSEVLFRRLPLLPRHDGGDGHGNCAGGLSQRCLAGYDDRYGFPGRERPADGKPGDASRVFLAWFFQGSENMGKDHQNL